MRDWDKLTGPANLESVMVTLHKIGRELDTFKQGFWLMAAMNVGLLVYIAVK